MPDAAPHRRFTPDEVRSILKSAARRQSAEEQATTRIATSLTIEDLERAAEEAGIEAAHVRRAAADLLETSETSGVVVRRTLSEPVTDAAWTEIVAELRRTYQGPGSTGVVGTTREWASGGSDSYRTVHATLQDITPSRSTSGPDAAESVLTLHRDGPALQQLATVLGHTFVGLIVFLGGVSLATGYATGAVVFLAILVLAAVLMYWGGPAAETWTRERMEADLDATLNRLELIAMKHAPEQEPARTGETEMLHTTETSSSSTTEVREEENEGIDLDLNSRESNVSGSPVPGTQSPDRRRIK